MTAHTRISAQKDTHVPYALKRATDFIDEWLAHQVVGSDITGLSVAICHKGHVVFKKAYGLADAERREAMATGHLFNIGSLSKMMTATLIMQLVEQSKIALEDKAAIYLPWLAQHRDSRMSGITIEQLLTHRAGLVRDGLSTDFWQLEGDFPDTAALQQMVHEADLVIDAGTAFKYSNLGYALLGQVIEAVAGCTYAELASEYIIQPLGLADAFAEYKPAIAPRVATGYTRRLPGGRRAVPVVGTQTFTAAAGWCATAADVCRFLAAHFAADDALLSRQTKQQMHRPQGVQREGTTEYGYGFMAQRIDGHTLIGHGGGFIGHRSYAFYDSKTDTGIVVLSNAKDAPSLALVRGILHSLDYFWQYATEPLPAGYAHLDVSLANLWLTMRIVPTPTRIVAVRLSDWLPLQQAEDLEYINSTTLKITKASDVAAEGELVTLTYTKNRLQYITYAGQLLRPKAAFAEWLAAHPPSST